MFFPERILSIKLTDKVLEIGPGATPYFRSDVFLEKEYGSKEELIAQSGHVGLLKTDKRVVTYSGEIFPFEDNEFDYVICSHVLEHVDDVKVFLNELQRVAKKGYLEFPTIYYDYIYNFPEHKNFLFYRNSAISWMTKEASGLNEYASIQSFFYRTIELKYYDIINTCRDYFFQGFEWFNDIKFENTTNLGSLLYSVDEISLQEKINIENTVEQNFPNYAAISIKKHFKFKVKQLTKRLVKSIFSHKENVQNKIIEKDENEIYINHGKYTLYIPNDMIWAFSGGKYYEKNVGYFMDQIFSKYKEPVFIDVGANYGYYSIKYSDKCEKIFSFEPVAGTYKIMEENIKRNSITNVISYKSGLSDFENKVMINLYSSSGNNSIFERSIPPEHPVKKIGTEQIQLLVLDDLLELGKVGNPNIIKIDVEGAELNVLKGARSTILKYRPTIMVEYSENTSIDAGYNRNILMTCLGLTDYKIYGIPEDPNDVRLIEEKDFHFEEISNLIFVPTELDLLA